MSVDYKFDGPSTGQNDSGLFEANLRDERYLPFEGRGAISRWHIALRRKNNSFDPMSIADLILHVRYTAREGGGLLAQSASADVEALITDTRKRVLYRAFSLRHDYPNEWHTFLTNGGAIGPLELEGRFPLLFSGRTIKVSSDRFYFVIAADRSIQPLEAQNTGGVDVTWQAVASAVEVTPKTQRITLDRAAKPLDLLIICRYSVAADGQ